MNNKLPNNNVESRQERREKKLKKKRERVRQHGRNLATIYKEVILKRIKRLRTEKQKQQGK